MKSFVDVANMEQLGDAHMFDVIGTIVSHYRSLTREINGKLTKLMDLVLEDLDGNTITATLWEKHAEDMIDFLNSAPEAPVVIILQFCRPNIYRGPSVEGIPACIEQLANKKALFNVSVDPGKTRNYTGSFSVARISTDRQIIHKICGENVIEDEASASINGAEMIEEMIGSSSSKSVVESRSTEVISKTIQQILEDGQSGEFTVLATINSIEDINAMTYLICKDEILDLLPAKVEGITTKKALFNIIVLPEQVKNFNGPFEVVRVAHEDSIVGETSLNQESPLKSKKGKELIDDIADEDILLRDSLLTPKKMTSNKSNEVNIMDDEHVKRKLNDEFSATTQKRNKRLLKKDKM
ncbi:hypothetical protein C2S52_011385 [Perilla frutescens var. hirtella]|nr:hypothetical protein C2S52_011385 [Perilla frutescens var. hirtella]